MACLLPHQRRDLFGAAPGKRDPRAAVPVVVDQAHARRRLLRLEADLVASRPQADVHRAIAASLGDAAGDDVLGLGQDVDGMPFALFCRRSCSSSFRRSMS